MIWKTVLVISIAHYVLCEHEKAAVSEQKVTVHHSKPHSSHHSHGDKNHEEYAWAYPSYEFSYKVNDPHTHDIKGQNEKRHGDEVKGIYWLLEPNGHTRTVNYHANDHKGFDAQVEYSAYEKHNENSHNNNQYSVHEEHIEEEKHEPEKHEHEKNEHQEHEHQGHDHGNNEHEKHEIENHEHVQHEHEKHEHENHEHEKHEHVKHEHENHEHGKHEHGNHEHEKHEHGNHEHGNHEHGKHEHGNHEHEKHEHENHEHRNHEHGNHEHGNHEHGNHEHGKHEHGNHEHGNNEHGKHEHGNHEHGNHEHGNNEHGKHEHGNHEHGKHEHENHEHGKHENHEHGKHHDNYKESESIVATRSWMEAEEEGENVEAISKPNGFNINNDDADRLERDYVKHHIKHISKNHSGGDKNEKLANQNQNRKRINSSNHHNQINNKHGLIRQEKTKQKGKYIEYNIDIHRNIRRKEETIKINGNGKRIEGQENDTRDKNNQINLNKATSEKEASADKIYIGKLADNDSQNNDDNKSEIYQHHIFINHPKFSTSAPKEKRHRH